MAVRIGQPVIPKQLPSDQKLREDVRKDSRDTGKPAAGKSTGKPAAGGANAKARTEGTSAGAKPLMNEGTSAGAKALVNEGTSAGAKALQSKDGMDVGGQVGHQARLDGGQGLADKQDAKSRFQQSVRTGGAHVPTQGPTVSPFREAAVASTLEQSEQEKSEETPRGDAAREAMEGRAKLRAALMDRLLAGMKDVHGRLAKFIKNPGRLGVVNLSLVLSESSLTYELWKEPSTVPERRTRMAQTLGVPTSLGDNYLLKALMTEVHDCFEEFKASRPGKEIRQQYDEVLELYENAGVLPVMPGFDMGPMQAELKRVGLPMEKEFLQSLLVHPRILAVGLEAEDGEDPQVMVAGLPVAQLGTIVAQLRRLNPRLTNRQVLNLMILASTDLKKGMRKILGKAEVENVQELAKQLLRLQGVELLYP
ncbi:hypothetical protein D187_005277 [Cystobacter fuscus DSM 2262]|uniref:Uncharacterized protein n=1 Tax=Cystobacter fuscus (strain ATCC 25194 / DSM 2262 / NBRC 100088 / M29) TaxID=1242864 RepID=S9R5C3_CYSF2|nr:hypothetical protein [Cystobacter fuscus]EPX64143.1 hypothetical protein D187_005277 [Cystobacter fuscus DSM 2262]